MVSYFFHESVFKTGTNIPAQKVNNNRPAVDSTSAPDKRVENTVSISTTHK